MSGNSWSSSVQVELPIPWVEWCISNILGIFSFFCSPRKLIQLSFFLNIGLLLRRETPLPLLQFTNMFNLFSSKFRANTQVVAVKHDVRANTRKIDAQTKTVAAYSKRLQDYDKKFDETNKALQTTMEVITYNRSRLNKHHHHIQLSSLQKLRGNKSQRLLYTFRFTIYNNDKNVALWNRKKVAI